MTSSSHGVEILYEGAFHRLLKCRYGIILVNKYDRYIGGGLTKYGEVNFLQSLYFSETIQPNWLVIDAGANIGLFTLLFSKLTGLEGSVYSFEPQKELYQLMVSNLALNEASNVKVFRKGLGMTPGQLQVPAVNYQTPNNFGSISLGRYEGGENVEVTTIDNLNLARCNFIKIDVEGMELAVLQGASRTIQKYSPILYVEHNHSPPVAKNVIDYMKALKYQLYWHVKPLYNPDNFSKTKENIFGRTHTINIIAIPQCSAINTESLIPLITYDWKRDVGLL